MILPYFVTVPYSIQFFKMYVFDRDDLCGYTQLEQASSRYIYKGLFTLSDREMLLRCLRQVVRWLKMRVNQPSLSRTVNKALGIYKYSSVELADAELTILKFSMVGDLSCLQFQTDQRQQYSNICFLRNIHITTQEDTEVVSSSFPISLYRLVSDDTKL